MTRESMLPDRKVIGSPRYVVLVRIAVVRLYFGCCARFLFRHSWSFIKI